MNLLSTALIFNWLSFWFPNLLIGPKVRIYESCHTIGYQWPIVTCMNTKIQNKASSRFCHCALLITIHPPPQYLRGIKLSQLRNSHNVTNLNKTPLYRHWLSVTTAGPLWPPAAAASGPFWSTAAAASLPFNSPFLLLPYYALPEAL